MKLPKQGQSLVNYFGLENEWKTKGGKFHVDRMCSHSCTCKVTCIKSKLRKINQAESMANTPTQWKPVTYIILLTNIMLQRITKGKKYINSKSGHKLLTRVAKNCSRFCGFYKLWVQIGKIQLRGDQREVLGKEPIKMTLSLSLWSNAFSCLALANSPVRNPPPKPVLLNFLPSKSTASPSLPPPRPLAFLVSPVTSSALSCTPQGQFVSFLKQDLWKTNSQDLHLSTSPSCWWYSIWVDHISHD